ncbi:MAG: alpha-1,2-fucosyltransferase [Phycisphaerales bacterium]
MRELTVRLSGGLGNQLFQYAAGRAVAIERSARLVLDARSFRRDRLRRFALGRYPITAERRDLAGWRRAVTECPGLWRLARATGFAPRIGGTRFLFDRLRGFDGRIHESCDELVLTGYWQDERYFAAVNDVLAREFDLSEIVDPATRRLGTELRSSIALAVHVRRGDFARSDSPHGTCSPSYYRRAVAAAFAERSFDRIVVFSDDPAWARELPLDRAFETMPRDPARGDDADLWLMSQCGGFVIANSSYSWWAARLAELRAGPTGTLVVCPARWYAPHAGPFPHPAPERWRHVAADDA